MNNKNKGILCIILSAFSFAPMSFFVKLSGDLPSLQKSFFRNFISLLVAYFILKKSGFGFKWQKGNFKYLILRSSFGTLGIIFNFYAIENLILSDASMLNKLAPFFAILFSFFILKEKIKSWQIISIIIAFIGSIFVINPSILFGNLSDFTNFPAFVGLMGAICAGGAYTMVRKLSINGEKGPFIVFFFSAFSCLVLLPYILIKFTPMDTLQIFYLILAGVFGSLGQFGVTFAYSFAPAKEISIFDYTQIIFSAILGYLVFNQIPNKSSIIGYIIIICVAIFMFIKNNQESY